ncbi:MAG: fumarylacetoacetate hydrolase family protein [Coxiellaceae bacterium]|nr:fumarylacetoacetate hydrolase family protein [Coxiellaceae bacterium]
MALSCPRIFCLGRNYVEHIEELGNEAPVEPVIFMKPYSSLGENSSTIRYPSHGSQLQFEAEIVVRIGSDLKPADITIGLDMTLRDVQTRLKDKGLPWEKAKSFDDSARTAQWLPINDIDLSQIDFSCRVNGEIKQQASSEQMIRSVEQVVAEVAAIWRLESGDLIYTGTPKGVGDLQVGDEIVIASESLDLNAAFVVHWDKHALCD